MATQTLLTVDQFLDLPDREGVRRELDEGRLIERPRASFLHGFVQGRRHVMGYRRSGETRRIASGQRLEEPDLLPGFSVSVDEIFAGMEELAK